MHRGQVFLYDPKTQVKEWITYLKENVEDLTDGLRNATILILVGHGKEDGSIGVADFIDEATGEVKDLLMRYHEELVRSFKTN